MRRSRKEDQELLEELEKERIRIENAKKDRLAEFNRLTREANKGKKPQTQKSVSRAHNLLDTQPKPHPDPHPLPKPRKLSHKLSEQQHGRTATDSEFASDVHYDKTSAVKAKMHRKQVKSVEKEAGTAFAQERRKRMQQSAKLRATIAQEQEEKRSFTLSRLNSQSHLHKPPKRKPKKIKRKTTAAKSPPDPEIDTNLYNRLRTLLKAKAQQLREKEPDEEEKTISNVALAVKMEELSAQLAKARELLDKNRRKLTREAAAVRIQRVYRRYRRRRKVEEKMLQLSAVQVTEKEKEVESDISLSSFLEKKQADKRLIDSLDLLARESALREENEGAKAELVDHFRRSLALGYRHLASAPLPPSDLSPLNTLRSMNDELGPIPEEVSLSWEPKSITKPRAETGCSPNDSREEQPSLDFVLDSARSLVECFEPKNSSEKKESPRVIPQASLRIPQGRRQALDLGIISVPPAPDLPADDSPSIGSLLRSAAESFEVHSYRDVPPPQPRNLWHLFTSEHISAIVEGILDAEINDVVELVAPILTTVNDSGISPTAEFIIAFLDSLLSVMKPYEDEFLAKVNKPKEIDFLKELQSISSEKTQSTREIEKLIPDEVFAEVYDRLSGECTLEDEFPVWDLYCRLMADVVNEALDRLRPEKSKGKAPPWRSGVRDVRRFSDITTVLCEVRDMMVAWSQAEMGKFTGDEMNPALAHEERMVSEIVRDVRGRQILVDDQSWVDYEKEELQTKMSVAEGVLDRLVEEALGCVAS